MQMDISVQITSAFIARALNYTFTKGKLTSSLSSHVIYLYIKITWPTQTTSGSSAID
jgi:hypothetical protein